MKKYFVNINQNLLKEQQNVLYQQLNVREQTNNNDSDEITEYLKTAGLPSKLPYCYAGIYFTFEQARKNLKLNKLENVLLKSGSTYRASNFLKAIGTEIKPEPAEYDLIFWKYKNKVFGHVEQIIKVIDNKTVITIGFNTSKGLFEPNDLPAILKADTSELQHLIQQEKASTDTEKQRNGNGVYIRIRKLTALGKMNIRFLIGLKKKMKTEPADNKEIRLIELSEPDFSASKRIIKDVPDEQKQILLQEQLKKFENYYERYGKYKPFEIEIAKTSDTTLFDKLLFIITNFPQLIKIMYLIVKLIKRLKNEQ